MKEKITKIQVDSPSIRLITSLSLQHFSLNSEESKLYYKVFYFQWGQSLDEYISNHVFGGAVN